MSLNESIVKDAALAWSSELGYAVGHGLQVAPGEPAAKRGSFCVVVLVGTPSLTRVNRAFHRMLRDGVPVDSTTRIANSF